MYASRSPIILPFLPLLNWEGPSYFLENLHHLVENSCTFLLMTVIYVFWCFISWRWASHRGHAKMLSSCFNQINFPSEKNKFFMSSWNCFWLCITCISIRSCVTRIYTQTSCNRPSNKHTGPSTMYCLLSVLYSSFFAEKKCISWYSFNHRK